MMFRPALAALGLSLPLASGRLIVPFGPLPAELPADPPLLGGAAPPALGVAGPHSVCKGDAPQYSGRLAAGGDAEYFFWLASARAPAPAPLILWLTGGPGCASTLALLTENGPCEVTGGGPGHWDTTRNPHSWTEAANVVWVDQPAGVGFSTGSPSGGIEDDVGQHMVAFLVNFYAHFPDLQSAPLFIFAESYGGHFGTATARAVLGAREELPFVRLTGVGIGNGWVHPMPQLASKPIMAYTGGPGGSLNGGVVDKEAFDRMEAGLPNCSRAIKECHSHKETCAHALNDECWGPLMTDVTATGLNGYDLRVPCGSDPMCYDMSLPYGFLGDPEVQQALGVSPSESWQVCNNSVWTLFAQSGDWLARLDGAVTELLAAGVSFLVYNGDTDYMCDWVGSKAWATELAWPHKATWAGKADVPYEVGGRVAGMERTTSGFTFLQIYQAGHMVPMDQPEVALAMVRELLHGARWRAPEPSDAAALSALATGPAVAAPLACAAALALFAGAAVRRWGSRGGVAAEGYAQLGA